VDEDDVGAGENVMRSNTVCKSVWKANISYQQNPQRRGMGLPCIPFLAIENATEYPDSEEIYDQPWHTWGQAGEAYSDRQRSR
jgi:hypothetical protein